MLFCSEFVWGLAMPSWMYCLRHCVGPNWQLLAFLCFDYCFFSTFNNGVAYPEMVILPWHAIIQPRNNWLVVLTRTTNLIGRSYFVTVLCVSWNYNPRNGVYETILAAHSVRIHFLQWTMYKRYHVVMESWLIWPVDLQKQWQGKY